VDPDVNNAVGLYDLPFCILTMESQLPFLCGYDPVQSIYTKPLSFVLNALQTCPPLSFVKPIVTHADLIPTFSALLCTVSAKSPHVYFPGLYILSSVLSFIMKDIS